VRRRIWLLTIGMTTLVVLAFAIPLAVLIRQNFEDRALREARLTAENTAYYISASKPDRRAIMHYLAGYDSDTAGRTSVVLPDGQVIGAAPPRIPDGDEDQGHEQDEPDPGHVSTPNVTPLGGGTVTEVKAATPSGTVRVLTYLTEAQMRAGVMTWWLLLAGACLGLLALSAGAAEIVTRRMVRSLTATARTADRLTHGDREARAPEEGVAEVAMVGRALNRLAIRIDELIADERETAADVSHRLRTPLTRLRLDVDALPDSPSARLLAQHVSHLERTLTAVIHAARRPQREGIAPSSDATAVAGGRVKFWSALAEDQGRKVVLALPDHPLLVRAAPEDLAAAVDALLENAVAHTPEGTAITVRLGPPHAWDEPPDATLRQGAVLVIRAEAPGIPVGAGRRGHSDRGSTGLGLDIARRCAEASGGELRIGSAQPHGARVELRLGAP
jgi:signal transduction histidine kinase